MSSIIGRFVQSWGSFLPGGSENPHKTPSPTKIEDLKTAAVGGSIFKAGSSVKSAPPPFPLVKTDVPFSLSVRKPFKVEREQDRVEAAGQLEVDIPRLDCRVGGVKVNTPQEFTLALGECSPIALCLAQWASTQAMQGKTIEQLNDMFSSSERKVSIVKKQDQINVVVTVTEDEIKVTSTILVKVYYIVDDEKSEIESHGTLRSSITIPKNTFETGHKVNSVFNIIEG